MKKRKDLKGPYETLPVPQVTVETPSFRDIHISNIICKGSDAPCSSTDCRNAHQNVTVKDVIINDAKKALSSARRKVSHWKTFIIETKGHTLDVKNAKKNLKVDGKVYSAIGAEGKMLDF